ncbi:apoptotic chromatin condensation inducer in the nucleus-like isoform X2 [Camellia sinensis]|uniref:apoptotic chromatin condensation inducer in the nucleus-like isoform X2 n=1 Tax=Camellia sinensis TaxID=4442 RepID=UPI001036490E|nr:apoptotic chromatin condensation inducer in the nucleus-like isoform X2 [Camellia sinensis]
MERLSASSAQVAIAGSKQWHENQSEEVFERFSRESKSEREREKMGKRGRPRKKEKSQKKKKGKQSQASMASATNKCPTTLLHLLLRWTRGGHTMTHFRHTGVDQRSPRPVGEEKERESQRWIDGREREPDRGKREIERERQIEGNRRKERDRLREEIEGKKEIDRGKREETLTYFDLFFSSSSSSLF